ncbi:SLC34A2 [Branchiostoma lanceolatum]|uniref:SLC34A2 protein n=1 Tax=Branchiostoma lanceolatum TaxID=7740 RepID=A0A8K0A791_BRALA|nr:SLC34A2 [Branchiostoma lanceolatum]
MCCVLGDFNLPRIDWANCVVLNEDLVFTDIPERFSTIRELPADFDTDHTVLEFSLRCRIQTRQELPRKVYNFTRADWHGLSAHLESLGLSESVTHHHDIDSAWEAWSSAVQSAVDMFVPSRKLKVSTSPPWIDGEVRNLQNKKRTAWKRAKRSDSPSHWEKFRGKAAGELFAQNELLRNPVCGLMIGVLVTVLVQSSSTSTSIVVSMVGAGMLEVEQSIYIVMGANIGTSVTNTIVSLAHSGDKNEFRRAFAGATIHDMFNWLCVFILLPLEAASHYLFRLSAVVVNSFQFTEVGEIKLLKVITEPFTKLIVEIDKGVITDIARNREGATEQSLLKRYCKTGPLVQVNSTEEQLTFFSNGTYNWTITENVPTSEWKHQCQYLFAQVNMWNDTIVGVILLVAALLILCICLACIVKLLHSILKGALARVIKRAVHAELPTKVGKYLTGYLIIILGAGMTFLVQSSSIFTSALTPLIAIGVVKLEQAYPLTLGANIGTTTTAILAALASSGDGLVRSLQLALCHFFFNVSGIILWYPIPPLRNVPIGLAKKLGNTTAKYRWFAIVYIILMFFLLPLAIFGLSVTGWETLVGVGVPLLVFALAVVVINTLQTKRPNWLPKKLRTWDFLPLALHSLEPYDRLLTGCCKKKGAEQAANYETIKLLKKEER